MNMQLKRVVAVILVAMMTWVVGTGPSGAEPYAQEDIASQDIWWEADAAGPADVLSLDTSLPDGVPIFEGNGASPISSLAPKYDWIKFSGHGRLRYESRQNYDFVYDRPSVDGVADNDDNFLLTRFRLKLDLKPSPYVHAHFSFQDAQEFGSHHLDHDQLDRRGINIFENQQDIHEAWLKLKLGECPFWIQAGRMQLNYGDQRLLGGFEWANTARAFDAVRFTSEMDNVKLDLVAANVVVVDSNAWDNSNDDDDLLMAYATIGDLPQGTQDLYFIYRNNNDRDWEIYTVGSRIDGSKGAFDWNFEGAYQWGTSTDGLAVSAGVPLDHDAFATHAELGYTSDRFETKPRLAIGYDFATGDEDPNDGKNNTFDNLFPTNHLFYGYMDFFSWRNIHNPYMKLSWKCGEKLSFKTHWHLFWLDEPSSDGWYNAGGGVIRNAASASADSFVGQELDFVASYALRENLKLEVGYGHFFADNYIADTSAGNSGQADDADFVYVQTFYSF